MNANFVTLPKSACALPKSSFYKEFLGIQLGVSGVVGFLVLTWLFGLVIARVRNVGPGLTATFSRSIMGRVVLLLELAYAPLAETALGMLSCRKIGSEWRLTVETELVCYTPEHNAYRKAAFFFIAIFVVGIPVGFGCLLYYYRIPRAALHLRQLATLRNVIDMGWQRGVSQPEVNTSAITMENITAEHVDALYRGIILLEKHGHSQERVMEVHGEGPLVRRNGEVLTRERQLAKLLKWAKQNLVTSHYTWAELRDEHDPRLEGSEDAIGNLYVHYLPVRWYFKIVETIIKLLLTSVLLFIMPGTAAQVVAGMFISGVYLLYYLRTLPYASLPVRRIAYGGNLTVFVFFVVALMLKMRVQIGHWNDVPSTFYDVVSGLLIYGFLFMLPILIIFNSDVVQYSRQHLSHVVHQDTKKQTKKLADKLAAKSGRLDVLPSDEHDHEPSSAVEVELEIESHHT